MDYDLISIGDLNLDILLTVPRFPNVDDEIAIQEMHYSPGGDAANLASAAAKLGLRVALVSCVGDDSEGQFLRKQLENNGVDIQFLQVDHQHKTGTVFAMVRPDGQRNLLTYRGANQSLAITPQIEGLLACSRAVHLSDPIPEIWQAVLIAMSHSTGFLTLDPGSITAERGIEALLPILSILFANEHEIRTLTRQTDLHDSVRQVLTAGVEMVVIKQGDQGCTVATPAEFFRVETFPVQVVDATGAGDAFDAAFLTGVLEGMPLVKAARFANAVGALVTTKLGAQSAQPTRQEVNRFLEKNHECNA
jgi:ribokinase